MPLFWAKIEIGNELSMPAKKELRPSANMPLETRFIYSSPSTGSPEIIELAVMSPVDSTAVIRYISPKTTIDETLNLTPYLKGVGMLKVHIFAELSPLTSILPK